MVTTRIITAVQFTHAGILHLYNRMGDRVNRERLKDILEVIGILSIVVTLIFVLFEIRQNTNAIRSTVIHSVSEQSMDVLRLLIENPELRESRRAIKEGQSTADQRSQVDYLYGLLIRLQQNRYLQSGLSVVDKDVMLLLGGQAPVYRTSDFRSYWNEVKGNHPTGFRDFMEENNINLPSDESLRPN